jgi:hypothetical protein
VKRLWFDRLPDGGFVTGFRLRGWSFSVAVDR